jgi:KaiC/GvpD/RAD55 family RecA-like ATPase
LIDPIFHEAGDGHVAWLVAERVDCAHTKQKCLLVFEQLAEHVLRRPLIRVAVGDALLSRNVADRASRRGAYFANAFRNIVGQRENLISVIVKQQVVIAKMRTTDVPMEVFGFEIERENISEKPVEGAGDLLHGFGLDVRWCGREDDLPGNKFVLSIHRDFL